jgi:multidrug efflux system membrane fusion protein
MKRLAISLGVVGILGAVAALVGCHQKSAQGAPASSASAGGERAVPVTVAKVEKKDFPIFASGLGTVTPLAMVTVKTQVDGRLDRVAFTEGQAVKKGELLAQIDPRPYGIQLEQGQASLARDDANLKNAQLNLQRYETLRQGNLIPQQQLDDQRAAVATSSAAVQADRASIASARLNLEYARIVSPIDGVTGVRLVDPGNIVHPADQTGIVIVTQLDPIAVIFTLPQDDLPRVQKALAQGHPAVEANARDDTTKLGQGELTVVDNQVNAQTATIRLKATFPNPERSLWPNAFVKAKIHLETRKGALVVPASAITRGPKGTFAYVVNADGTATMKPVEVASIEGESAVVEKGLNAGDTVVTDGQNQIKPGAKVAPRTPAKP